MTKITPDVHAACAAGRKTSSLGSASGLNAIGFTVPITVRVPLSDPLAVKTSSVLPIALGQARAQAAGREPAGCDRSTCG